MNVTARDLAGSQRDVFAEIVRLQQQGKSAVLCFPLWWEGSVPFGRHARLLVREDGSFLGTLGGGALEAAVLRAACAVAREGKARVLEFDLAGDGRADAAIICGGRCAVLLEAIAPAHSPESFSAAARAVAQGRRVALLTRPAPGELEGEGWARVEKLALFPRGEVVGLRPGRSLEPAVMELAMACLADGRPRFSRQPGPVHVDPLVPAPVLYIFGAGHVALPLALLADLVGLTVVVIDDREEFANRARFPWAAEVFAGSVAEAFSRFGIGAAGDSRPPHYVVAVTRGHALDEEVVAHALATGAEYVGMMGSRRKVALVHERLRGRGFTEEQLARLHAPIGLDIRAETPEEIAVSIVAEIIACRRKEEAAG